MVCFLGLLASTAFCSMQQNDTTIVLCDATSAGCERFPMEMEDHCFNRTGNTTEHNRTVECDTTSTYDNVSVHSIASSACDSMSMRSSVQSISTIVDDCNGNSDNRNVNPNPNTGLDTDDRVETRAPLLENDCAKRAEQRITIDNCEAYERYGCCKSWYIYYCILTCLCFIPTIIFIAIGVTYELYNAD